MTDENTTETAATLIDNFGKHPFTYAQLSKEVTFTSRRQAYRVLAELVATGYVERVSVDKGTTKVAAWRVKPADESNAIALFERYPSE